MQRLTTTIVKRISATVSSTRLVGLVVVEQATMTLRALDSARLALLGLTGLVPAFCGRQLVSGNRGATVMSEHYRSDMKRSPDRWHRARPGSEPSVLRF